MLDGKVGTYQIKTTHDANSFGQEGAQNDVTGWLTGAGG
jgi:hypothetical protein